MPVDELKIDRSFVKDMATDADDATIVRSTVELAHNMGLKVVAEGVEDQTSYDLLARLGCDYAQGYLMGRPQSAEQFQRWLRESAWGMASGADVGKTAFENVVPLPQGSVAKDASARPALKKAG
ncbi:MAG: EAL domain-containing protein [Acidobacteria bacterium]|nr:MAG: EAL domain-containing protein [Acidobacteriota bacterium]